MFSSILSSLNYLPLSATISHPHLEPDNLLLLSTVALDKRKRSRKPNPLCSLPGHSKWRVNASIQRHTCSSCFRARAEELFANPNLTRWDVACLLVREFRNYFCCCCILDADPKDIKHTVHIAKSCRRGHRSICKERRCVAHKQRLTICNKCPDPRAGTSYHLCGHRIQVNCNCKNKTVDASKPQDSQVVEVKAAFAANMLRRAGEIEAAGTSLETESDSPA